MAERQVSSFQAPRQLGRHGAQFHGVAARLEDGEDALTFFACGIELAAQAVDRGVDGRRVVGEVVVDRDITACRLNGAPHFHAAFDVLEARQCFGGSFRRNAHMLGGGDGSQRIELVVHTADGPLHPGYRLAGFKHFEVIGFAVGGEALDIGWAAAKEYPLTPAAFAQHALQAGFLRIDHNPALRRHGADEMVKLPFDGGQVIKDVGMVKLKVVQDCRARAVMHELAALVEEGGVVFVGLDHKGVAFAQARRNTKVERHAADQKARLQASAFKNPGQHRGRGRLAVCAGDGQHMARAGRMVRRVVQHMARQPLRATGVGKPAVQYGFHERVFGAAVGQMRTRDDIANHKHIRLKRHLVGAIAFDQLDAEGAQLVAHGRVDAGVATRHLVAGLARQCSQAAHEGAANPQYMYVHECYFRSGQCVGVSGLNSSFAPNRPEVALNVNTLQSEIAATAAALVVEEGLEYGQAKRRAVKQMALPQRTELPGNDLIEDAVLEYIAIFCADTQPVELAALRELALVWMERMGSFRPYLAGAVWHGTATRLSDIYIQLFCDDPKSAEIALIDHNVDYEPRTVKGFTGGSVEALSLSSLCKPLNENVGVHFMVYDHNDLRGALKPDPKGRTPRGDIAAVQKLLAMPSRSDSLK